MRCSSGPAIIVVTIAITIISEYSDWSRMRSCRPTERITIPVSPRVFNQRGENPGAPSTDPRETGADEGTAELADDSDQQDEA
ncbi:hypothetical protein, partial [Trebonia sp.]|uniref:hypothetical protein n=1 Tax=Trebonia sp. TaxID=2767075 RepID=UPI003CC666C3